LEQIAFKISVLRSGAEAFQMRLAPQGKFGLAGCNAAAGAIKDHHDRFSRMKKTSAAGRPSLL